MFMALGFMPIVIGIIMFPLLFPFIRLNAAAVNGGPPGPPGRSFSQTIRFSNRKNLSPTQNLYEGLKMSPEDRHPFVQVSREDRQSKSILTYDCTAGMQSSRRDRHCLWLS